MTAEEMTEANSYSRHGCLELLLIDDFISLSNVILKGTK